jgi:signal transduction histidine kinase
MQATENRIRSLVEAGIALSSELSLDALLQKLVHTAAELTGARYAAMGVIDRSGTSLERFITHGIDAETHRAIGDLPRGRGILGVLINDATPLRLHDIGEDPRSVGFPPNHPPMRSFLGVPVRLRRIAYGNLYLTEKEDGRDFTADDEELVTLLATQAAVAIENARLYESATRWSRQLESLNEIASALVNETHLASLLQLIAQRLRELVEARVVTIALPAPDGGMTIVAGDGEMVEEALASPSISAHSKARAVFDRRRSERVDSVLDDPEVDQDTARRVGSTSAMWVPLVAGGKAMGVITCHDKRASDPRFDDADMRLAEAFAQRAAVAVDRSERVARDSLRRVVDAQELERRRLARELHDETGQALTSILLGLKSVEDAPDEGARERAAADLRELVVTTLQDVRRLAVELRPSALDDFGLVAALTRLADTFSEQMGIETSVEASGLGDERLPAQLETALYRIVQEALTNVVKHARATRVTIVLIRNPRSVTAVVEDNGIGFAPEATREGGLGLIGMTERVGLLNGRLDVESARGSGTSIVVEVPLP